MGSVAVTANNIKENKQLTDIILHQNTFETSVNFRAGIVNIVPSVC